MQTKTPSVYKRQLRGLRQQSGAVLVIGLIILVVLTMLGVQGMRTNVAQERMAGNIAPGRGPEPRQHYGRAVAAQSG